MIDLSRTAMVTSYPPSRCGVGRFAASLNHALTRAGVPVDVFRTLPPCDEPSFDRGVVMEFDPDSPLQVDPIVHRLDRYGSVIVQHEFGLYGPDDGALIVDIVEALSRPVITVLHTVVPRPTDRQRAIIIRLADESRIVVPSHSARVLLDDVYGIPPDSVSVIPHGTDWSAAPPNPLPRRTILSWGLLGPGKGLERVIRSLPLLSDLDPPVIYRIAGQTHPTVLKREGGAYRESLAALAADLGVADQVVFDEGYKSDDDLYGMVAAADLVAIPYDNQEQISSGVLVDALSVGRPVVATRFPHAVELLTGGSGTLVDHDDDEQLAGAMGRLLTDEVRYRLASFEGERQTARMTWSRVADRYRALIDTTLRTKQSAV